MPTPLFTLLTDFGTTDHRAAALTAHLLRHAPTDARLVVISHDVPPFDLAHAAWVLGAAFAEFPEGTIHVVAVAARQAAGAPLLAAQFRGHFFVLPDNGLLTLLTDGAPAAVVRLPLQPGPARVGLGRAAGLLAQGKPLETLGEVAETVVELHRPQIGLTDNQLLGHVQYVDRYGNLVTNLTRDMLIAAAAERPYTIRFGPEAIQRVLPHYSAAEPGEVACVFDSRGHLCIGLRQASAAQQLGLRFSAPVEITFG